MMCTLKNATVKLMKSPLIIIVKWWLEEIQEFGHCKSVEWETDTVTHSEAFPVCAKASCN